jgi:two-component system response regulator HydG
MIIIHTMKDEFCEASASPIGPIQMRVANVLVVDDDLAVCRIVQRMLSDVQHMVQTCQSVADALEAIEKRPFDAYVMNYKLPDGTRLEVAERVRSKWGATPIILMSGYDSSAVELRAANLQITDFIEKPFSREIICNAVEKAIGLPAAPASASEKPPGRRISADRFRSAASSPLQTGVAKVK